MTFSNIISGAYGNMIMFFVGSLGEDYYILAELGIAGLVSRSIP